MNNVDIFQAIFDNAIASIELGIEDYKLAKGDSSRYLSAVRNLFAGLLLLFKSKLAEVSKDDNFSLLIAPSVKTPYDIQQRPKTVGYYDLIKRLKEQEVNVDWEKIKDLHAYRNDIEHYFAPDSKSDSIVRGYIANSFLIIKQFLEKDLGYNPQECFAEDIWQEFLKDEAVHSAEIAEMVFEFDKLLWFSDDVEKLFLKHRCHNCNSDIIRVDDKLMQDAKDTSFICRNCGRQWIYYELAKEIANKLSQRDLWELKDGGTEIIGYCPECEEEMYCSIGEVCLNCGVRGPFECEFCGCEVPISELIIFSETGRCSWCEHQFEKIMEED
ncbi:MAG: hypothetical protein E7050_05535 [Lentisphaerae bacterium]|nr:hypothetical protein [Lentisphaerota bacterium]